MNVTNRVSLYVGLVISASVAVVCLALHQYLPSLCLRLERARVARDVDHIAADVAEAQREVQVLAEQMASSDDIRNVFTGRSSAPVFRLHSPTGKKDYDVTYLAFLTTNRDLLLAGRIGERMRGEETLDPALLQAFRSHKEVMTLSPLPRARTAAAARNGKATLIAIVPVLSRDALQPLGHVALLRFIDDSLVKKIAFRAQANFSVMPVEEAVEQDQAIRANLSKITFNKMPVVTETDGFVTGYGSIKDSQGTTNILISAVRRRELSEVAAGIRPYLLMFIGPGIGIAGVIALWLSRLSSAHSQAKASGGEFPDDSVPFPRRVSADALMHLSGSQQNPLSASIIPSDDRIDDLEKAIAYWWNDIAASSALTSMWSAEDVLDIRDVYQRMGRSHRRVLVVLEAFHDCFTEQSDLVMDAYHAKDEEQLLFAMGASRGYLLDVSARKAVTLCSRIESLAKAHNVGEALALVPSLADQMRMLFCLISRILSSSATILSPKEVSSRIEKATIS